MDEDEGGKYLQSLNSNDEISLKKSDVDLLLLENCPDN
jgi:hypothetical protein